VCAALPRAWALARRAPAPSLLLDACARCAVGAAARRGAAGAHAAGADARSRPAAAHPTAALRAQATLASGAMDGARVALRVKTGEEGTEPILLCAFRCAPPHCTRATARRVRGPDATGRMRARAQRWFH
jgi:hypothetical protein